MSYSICYLNVGFGELCRTSRIPALLHPSLFVNEIGLFVTENFYHG